MKRLTRRIDSTVLIAEDIDGRYTANEVIDILAERLAAYEDILGDTYDLDYLRDLIATARASNLTFRHIKPGDAVYWILEDEVAPGGWYISDPEIIADVGTKGFYLSGVRDSDEPGDNPSFVPLDVIGKDVFLSREEAEVELVKKEIYT